ncbi:MULTISPECIES: DNA gyrase subunit A [Thermoactinomyces]|jgi:DNA gyrase subunit A|uniref:DNA gyrase subunit A n=1 Tax=Thermoactinomyces daqus TaxID=1329516 RepID=A0A7W1X8I9_9BACL|nr:MULTISPECIES: DNA gyrase subunit A [Thermoactinomyces]MBA4541944.1 DNA gyrase subunit A [Thermoactinomyces daqus]MBH8597943.1 DNA gyrase subunit A [Thermoactinomyces sp. CICC 10523]MBH8604296.1 DNA gyrase subunit A [Thermoactinomyces sp. CICC 10522]
MPDMQRIQEVNISKEMKSSFLDYAMSVIVSRALPDVRDGLKPVHRRILYTLYELGMTPDKPYKKSSRVVGNVTANYHPHGDVAVYDAMVRMAQDFSYRYPLVDGHGNFGSIDGDSPAAMRYTEARMAPITMELLRDIQKDTIDFGPNYDGQQEEPLVLPSRFPNLIVNGASGIAVGMATNIPPHNLSEVIDGILLLLDNPEATIEDLMRIIKGPDFPTGGIILGHDGIRKSYRTGRGSIRIRAKTRIEEAGSGKMRIVVEELPYQVNKAKLVEKIAELVRDKKIDGITDLRDESDRNGMRVVIELRRDVNPRVILNNLYKHTSLQSSFGVNMLALVDGQPQVLNIKSILSHYIDHQVEVIRRRTQYDLNKAEERAHILEGLRIALDQIDEVIALIRASATTAEARTGLMEKFGLSEKQAQAILDMRLHRLTGLEREKIEAEYGELQKLIAKLKDILADEAKIRGVVRDELKEIKERYGDERRTMIKADEDEIEDEDLIPEDEVAILLTQRGYIKRMPLSTYRAQRRGGKGITGMGTREDDLVQHMFVTHSHNHLLFFSNKGKVYRLKAYEVPELGRTARGTPVINLIQIDQGERIEAVIPVKEFLDNQFLFFATAEGIVKKTALSEFENIRRNGLFAINLRDGDELVGVRLTDGNQEVLMGTRQGMSIRFHEMDVREMGRSATGVKGITLGEDDRVIDMDIVIPDKYVLIVTRNGYGKRTPMEEYRIQSRGGKGIKTLSLTEKKGDVVAHKVVSEDEDLMIVTQSGIVIRLKIAEISVMGRYAQGVKLISLDEDEVSAVARVHREEEEDGEDGNQ